MLDKQVFSGAHVIRTKYYFSVFPINKRKGHSLMD